MQRTRSVLFTCGGCASAALTRPVCCCGLMAFRALVRSPLFFCTLESIKGSLPLSHSLPASMIYYRLGREREAFKNGSTKNSRVEHSLWGSGPGTVPTSIVIVGCVWLNDVYHDHRFSWRPNSFVNSVHPLNVIRRVGNSLYSGSFRQRYENGNGMGISYRGRNCSRPLVPSSVRHSP